MAKLSAAKSAGNAELTAGLFRALQLVHDFIKTGAGALLVAGGAGAGGGGHAGAAGHRGGLFKAGPCRQTPAPTPRSLLAPGSPLPRGRAQAKRTSMG